MGAKLQKICGLSKFSTYKFVLFHIFHNFVYAYFKALLWVTGQKVAQ